MGTKQSDGRGHFKVKLINGALPVSACTMLPGRPDIKAPLGAERLSRPVGARAHELCGERDTDKYCTDENLRQKPPKRLLLLTKSALKGNRWNLKVVSKSFNDRTVKVKFDGEKSVFSLCKLQVMFLFCIPAGKSIRRSLFAWGHRKSVAFVFNRRAAF